MSTIKSKMLSDTRVRTGLVRFSYAHVFEPYGINETNKKYSVSLLIPKDDTLTIENIKKAMENANEIGESKVYKGKKIKDFFAILHDGDIEKEDDPDYAGHYYINASSTSKPQVVDRFINPIEDETEFYSGCYGIASINFYPYNTNNNKGVACGLNNLMKIKDGEALTSRLSIQDEFRDLEIELEDNDLI